METDRIKPLYFPFTYISDRAASAISACFGKIGVLRPTCGELPSGMGEWMKREILEPAFPSGADDGKINGIIAGYREWSTFNPGVRREGFTASSGKTPFFDDDSTMGIRTALGRRERGEDSAPVADTLLNARVFLAMAEAYDLENDRIDQELSRVSMIEKGLFDALRGEAELPASEDVTSPDPGDYMPEERIEAWSRLCRAVDGAEGARLLVTDSRAVEAFLLENMPALTRVIVVEGISLAPEGESSAVSEAIAGALDNPGGPAENRVTLPGPALGTRGETISLTVYRVPEGGLQELFSGGSGLIGVVGY